MRCRHILKAPASRFDPPFDLPDQHLDRLEDSPDHRVVGAHLLVDLHRPLALKLLQELLIDPAPETLKARKPKLP